MESFTETIGRLAGTRATLTHSEPFAGFEYPDELALKEKALRAFWSEHRLPGAPDPTVPAPQPRGYRTTSKRRLTGTARGLTLRMPGLMMSRLDPRPHLDAYSLLEKELVRPGLKPLASVLTWAIVRGTAPALALILNVRKFDAKIVKAAKQLAEALEAGGIRSAFLYLDPTGSEYYLEAERPEGFSFKRLFGPDWLQVEAAGLKLRFPPTAFSQVNGAMLDVMVETVSSLLAMPPDAGLVDLYCGYGLFTLTIGRDRPAVGVDIDGPAIEAARGNAAHLRVANRVRFMAGRIDAKLIHSIRPTETEAALLDPPRSGTAPGVVEAVAARRPVRVVHICCGSDEIPRELASWYTAGFRLRRAVPLDLFAGTANLETLLMLEPA